MNQLAVDLPSAGVVRVIGPEEAGAGFLVSASGLIVTCAHVLARCAPGDTVSVEPLVGHQPLPAAVDLLQDPPDVAVLRLTAPVPPEAMVLPLGRSPNSPQPGLRTFGYPQMRPEIGLPGELAFYGVTAADGYDQLALRSEEATLGFSGAPIWDAELGAVVGMIKSIARGDPAQRLGNTAIGVPVEVIRNLCPALRLPADCPYRALEPFTEDHVDFYYGREHATSQLLTSLAARDFVPVVAISGGGKSSLLQAGLAKGLQDRPVVGLAQRIRCYHRVSDQPHAELLQSLAQHGILLPQELAAAPPQELAAAIRGAIIHSELIVVVDQFERLYTDCKDADRNRFVALLQCLATDPVKVVIGLRADFYHLALADLGERLAAGQVALAPMTEQELSRAVAAPAEKLLRSFQPGLTQQLIEDVRGRPGDLPLLQFALTELWERDAAGGVLTMETYRGLGVELPDGTHLPGAQGALIRRAEQVWHDLDSADQLRLQRILLGLIAAQPAEISASLLGDMRDLSRPARLAQWDEDDQQLIQRLIDTRLLTADKTLAGGQPTVEVSHEALLRAWPRLRNWLAEHSQFVQWRAQDLAPNLERWFDSDKNPEFLLPRSLLEPALRWLRDYPDKLTGPQARYIQASKRRRTRRRGLLSGAVAVLVAASLVAAGVFYSLQQTAVQRQKIATSRLLIMESETLGDTDPVLSKLLSVAAWRVNPSSDAQYAMLAAANLPGIAALAATTGSIHTVAFSPDGKILATGSQDGRVRLWDVATRRQVGPSLTVGTVAVNKVAFSPDGKILAAASITGTVRLWDVANGRLVSSIYGGRGVALDLVAFSPDGKILAAGGWIGTPSVGLVRLWDLTTGHEIANFRSSSAGEILSVAFSPDSKVLATGSLGTIADPYGTVRLWDIASRQEIGGPFAGDIAVANSVAFSPDGKILVGGGQDGTVRLWDVATRQQIGSPMSANAIGVTSVAFSPDGRTLGAGSQDGTVRLWDVATQQQIGVPLGADDRGVTSVAFSPDGKTLATGNEDGTARLWDVPVAINDPLGTPLVGDTRDVTSVAFSPDGKILATGSYDGTARLWDVATQQQIGAPLADHAGTVDSVAFSPDGKILATGNEDGTVQLWELATRQEIGMLGIPLTGLSKWVTSVAFSPDGKTLAAGNEDGTVQLWDVATRQQISTPVTLGALSGPSLGFSHDGKILAIGGGRGTVQLWDMADRRQTGTLFASDTAPDAVAFNPDGKILATGNADDTARLWDVATRQQIGPALIGGTDWVVSVSFSPNGEILATGSKDGSVRLWDVATQQQIGSPFTGNGQADDVVNPVTFSPDGKVLATGSSNGTVQLWDVAYLTDLVPYLCASAGRSFTHAEWTLYAPGLAYQNICT